MPRPLRVLFVLLPAFAFAAVGAVYLAGRWDEPDPPLATATAKGRLVVVAVFDQMRGDYPTRWAKLYGPNGFARIARDGVTYRNARLPYSCSSTAPGHASLGTGFPPSVHGVIENRWFDRTRHTDVLSTTSFRQTARVPKSEFDSGDGFTSEQLLCDGVGDRLKAADPAARVFSLALKDRSAALLGGKKPDGVYCFDTSAGEFHTTSYYRDAPHQWVTAFNGSKAADRWFTKRWERLGDEATYTAAVGPDDVPGETQYERDFRTGRLVGYGSTFPHQLNIDAQKYPNKRYYERLESSPFGNELLWEFARSCIEAEHLGRESTDLLFLGFSSNDTVGHRWGPDSHEVLDITMRTDELIAAMIDHLDKTIGRERYTLVVTADHGICPLPEAAVKDHPDAARFDPRFDLGPDGLGKVLNETFGVLDPTGFGWFERLDREFSPWVYLNRRAIRAHGADPDAVAAFSAKWAANRPHMHAAYPAAALAGPPSADPLVRSAQLGYHPDRCGDVYLIPKPYCLPLGVNSVGTSHGSPHPYDTHVPLMAIGAGVPKAGAIDAAVNSLAVAPMIAAALGMGRAAGWVELPTGWGN
jgi:hypothetical protein